MMKVMLAAIEIFSLVYQRIFAQKVLTQRKHSRVWECFVWGMYFVISNFFTYSFAKSAWDNTGIFVVSFFFALRILYIDSAWVLSAVTAFMAISGALSEVLTYYGWQIFVQKSGVKVDTANEDYLLLLVSKLVMFFFIKILLALIKRHKNIRLNTQEWVEIFMIPGGSIVILAEMICQKESMSETLDFVAALMVMLINIFTYYLYDKIGETAEKRVREEVLQEQSEYYLRQYNENMNLWVEMSEFRHNMTERYLMEKMYLEKGDYEALKKYCDNSLEKLHKQRKVSNTGCFYFDSIINYKAAVAETFDIKFETKLMIQGYISIRVADRCCICFQYWNGCCHWRGLWGIVILHDISDCIYAVAAGSRRISRTGMDELLFSFMWDSGFNLVMDKSRICLSDLSYNRCGVGCGDGDISICSPGG